MLYIIKKSQTELKREARKNHIAQDRMAKRESQLIKQKKRNINAGYSQPGYNFGLGKFIRNKDHYKREIAEAKVKDPNFNEAH